MKIFKWISLFLLIGGLPTIAGLQTPSALKTIQEANQKVLDIYAGAPEVDRAAKNEIVRIMESVTDLDSISHNTLDRFCQDLTPQQCQDLSQLFKKLLRSLFPAQTGALPRRPL